MNTYEIHATLGRQISGVTFSAPSDDQAIMEAVDIIMDRAYDDKSGPWALGSIALTNSQGETLQTMEAK
jgi:hypothetical protein